MPAKVWIGGSKAHSDFEGVQAALKLLAKTGEQRKLGTRIRKRLRQVADQIGPEVLAAGIDEMPSSGGLADRLRANGQIAATLNGSGVALRLKSGRLQMRGLDRGFLRHPVYADSANKTRDEWAWVTQRITPKAWTRAFEAMAPEVREEIAKELESMLTELRRELQRKAG